MLTASELERSPGSFRVDGRAAGVGDRSDGAVGLLLLNRNTKNIDSSFAVNLEMARAGYDSVPIWEDQDGRSRELGKKFANDNPHGGCERKLGALCEERER